MRAALLSVQAIIALIVLAEGPLGRTERISYKTVNFWAGRLGFELSQLGKYVTRIEELQESYSQAEVKPRDGNALVQEIAKDVGFMMESKISAVKRIMDVAETLACDANTKVNGSLPYNDAKHNKLEMTHSNHFGRRVNLNYSNFHIPTNVFNQSQNVIEAIAWAENLNATFINNYNLDPSLSWQYFGSSTGFMMQYPAINWTMEPVDLFDCRTRSWYIEAATSPKDILILVDNSGSMTGIRKEIARHVVESILDTLGNNDFVNIITFSNETLEIVDCFKNTLVQANLANIRELKNAMNDIVTDGIANFTFVLNRAFELLEEFRERREGALCNQAIMLVTDGVPYNYKEIFQRYNWRDNPEDPDKADMPVRVFTYLIGREVADVREVKWMACANRGYYVHLSTMAEVSEKVLNYVPVMARPLVLRRTDHPVIWTPVYADVTDPKMTDWLWDQKLRSEQRETVQLYRIRNKNKRRSLKKSREEQDRRFVQKHKRTYGQDDDLQEYRLMTSVSVPVFNRRNSTNITEQVLVKEAYWVTRTRETRIAELLGVAGIDVPIKEIEKLMLPHMLGVDGYAFIVTNNGYILIHPDLRAVFGNILKPAYNSVDMVEVELMDQGNGARQFETSLLAFREDVIDQKTGSVTLHTKYHYDDMQRVGRVRRKYFYTKIGTTPFTVVVALPERDHSGNYRVHAIEEIHRNRVETGKNVTEYFSGSNWRVHPDWTYCEYHYDDEHKFNTSEEELLHFLDRTCRSGWRWMDNRVGSQPPEHSHTGSPRANASRVEKHSYYCDRNLLLSLVFDAKVTEWFANSNTTREEKGKEFQRRFGFTLAFMATHSGLTRWQDFPIENDTQPEEHFGKLHPKATDEVWYRRAVEQHYVQPDSFVFSVPIDEGGADNDTLVTASQAIFIGNGKSKAPAAVVGFQFKHSKLQSLFRNITFSCEGISNCQRSCENEGLDCYLLDNNAYVVAAENASDAGKFFGEINSLVMRSLIREGIYDEITIFDYQAVCFEPDCEPCSHASALLTPLKTLERVASWFLGRLVWLLAKTTLWPSDNYAYGYSYPGDIDDDQMEEDDDEGIIEEEEEEEDEDPEQTGYFEEPRTLGSSNDMEQSNDSKDEKDINSLRINRTSPQTCDKQMQLYLLRNVSAAKYDVDFVSVDETSKDCDRPYVVQPVNSSNMILLVVLKICPNINEKPMSILPEEIKHTPNLACYKAAHSLSRRRPPSCIRNHTKEREIQDLCGGASSGFRISLLPILLPILISILRACSFLSFISSSTPRL